MNITHHFLIVQPPSVKQKKFCYGASTWASSIQLHPHHQLHNFHQLVGFPRGRIPTTLPTTPSSVHCLLVQATYSAHSKLL